jgi:hypothetical protein
MTSLKKKYIFCFTGGECSTHRKEDKCIKGFGRKTCRKHFEDTGGSRTILKWILHRMGLDASETVKRQVASPYKLCNKYPACIK